MTSQYLELSRKILSSDKSEFVFNVRRGVGRIKLFGEKYNYNLKKEFPLLTTKKIGFKTVAHELIWFLRGDTNIKYLVDNGVHIWDSDAFHWNLEDMVTARIFSRVFEKDSKEYVAARKEYVQRVKENEEFAARWGGLGPVYGSQWMKWPFFVPTGEKDGEGREIYVRDPNGINQIERILEGIRKNPTSSRHIVTSWNPVEVPNMALPPCHTFFHLNSNGEDLDLLLYQRSCDMFLGVPFNDASYALVTTILAQQLGFKPRIFEHVFGDVHFYTGAGQRAGWYRDNFERFRDVMMLESKTPQDYRETLEWLNHELPPEPEGTEGADHVTGILEQLPRGTKTSPRLSIADKPYNELTIDDFNVEGYDPHPTISRKLMVG